MVTFTHTHTHTHTIDTNTRPATTTHRQDATNFSASANFKPSLAVSACSMRVLMVFAASRLARSSETCNSWRHEHAHRQTTLPDTPSQSGGN